jgi:hypothetical protein
MQAWSWSTHFKGGLKGGQNRHAWPEQWIALQASACACSALTLLLFGTIAQGRVWGCPLRRRCWLMG